MVRILCRLAATDLALQEEIRSALAVQLGTPALVESTCGECSGISSLFECALETLAGIHEEDVRVKPEKLRAELAEWHRSDGYGVYSNVFEIFAKALGEITLEKA